MSDDRRSVPRARLSGVRVAYESAAGEVHQADVTDLSRDALFVASAAPLAVGKRLSLEIHVAGEPAPWAALGRVVRVREIDQGDALPAGMVVKIIDAEDTVLGAIERLVEARELTAPGLGDGDRATPAGETPVRGMPARERTVLGIGATTAGAPGTKAPAVPATPARAAPAAVAAPVGTAAAAPVATRAPQREKTMLGVGIAVGTPAGVAREHPVAAPAPELSWPSIADDAPRESSPTPVPTTPPPEAPARAPSTPPAAEARARVPSTPPAAEAPARVPSTPPTADVPARVPSAPPADASPVSASKVRPREDPDQARKIVSEPPVQKRGGGGGWLFLLFLIVAGGAAGYVFRDRLLPYWRVAVTTIARQLR